MRQVLPPTFFARSPLVVARQLLAKVLVRGLPDGSEIAGLITEAEAYWGERDPGSHAFRGPTPRNAVMFGPAAHIYVYFIYGMHHCVNIVTGEEGKASAVLLRGVHLLTGEGRADGPGKLCRAMHIDKQLNTLPLDPAHLSVQDWGHRAPRGAVARTARIGLSAGQDLPWRFVLERLPSSV